MNTIAPLRNKKIVGVYNALMYRIELVDHDTGEVEEISRAGNSRWESQGYLTADEGVGVEEMKRMCTIMVEEFARDNDYPIRGVFYEAPEEDEA